MIKILTLLLINTIKNTKSLALFNYHGYMEAALESAFKAYKADEIPVGAIIVHKDRIIAYAHNLVNALVDPTAHAEILAIKEAAQKLSTHRLVECDLYTTLEPCPMCAQAISFARIRKLYFGAYDQKGGGVENGARVFYANSCHHSPEIYGGIMEHKCAAILQEFFAGKR